MKVRITSYSTEESWYRNRVGETFEVSDKIDIIYDRDDRPHEAYILKSDNDYLINSDDCIDTIYDRKNKLKRILNSD